MRMLFAASLAGLVLAAQAIAGEPTPEERYQAALKTLNAKCDQFCGYGVGDPAEVQALDALWDATEDWTVAYLATHSPRDLSHTLEKLETQVLNRHPNDAAAPDSVVMLAPDLIAMTARWGATGTVFLVGKRDGKWAAVWDIRKSDTKKFAVLASWQSAAARDNCWQNVADERWLDCGPLSGAVTPLSPDSQGRPRFLLRATYAQMAGVTVADQVSFWRWNGRSAEPVIAQTYAFMIDDGSDVVTADEVSLWVKDEFKTFFSCGGCIGRQVRWTFRILPDRIVDEGKKPVVPELDVIDDFLLAVLNAKPVANIASAEATAALKAILGAHADAVDADMSQLARLGMEMDRTVTPTTTGATICLSADGLDATQFVLEHRTTGFFVRSVRRDGRDSCRQPTEK